MVWFGEQCADLPAQLSFGVVSMEALMHETHPAVASEQVAGGHGGDPDQAHELLPLVPHRGERRPESFDEGRIGCRVFVHAHCDNDEAARNVFNL
jgi:hypothetical protein